MAACAMHHCCIVKNEGRRCDADPPAMLIDKSNHGTFCNGVKVNKQGHQLWTGDVISFFAPKASDGSSQTSTEEGKSGDKLNSGSDRLEDTTLVFHCDTYNLS